MPTNDFDHDELLTAEAESEIRLKRPPMFRVLLHNDNFTSMEFVVFVLQNIFGRSEADAVHIMLKVHNEGVGIAGEYTFEIAEMKVEKVTALAQESEFPLLCTIEEASTDEG